MRIVSFGRAAMVTAALAVCAPLPALAQDAPPADAPPADAPLANVTERLADPATQQVAAVTLSTLVEALLDLPIAPLANAVRSADPDALPDIDDNTTVRQLAGPDAEDVPAVIRAELPRAMDMMAGMAAGFEALLPALKDMAEQFEQSVEEARKAS